MSRLTTRTSAASQRMGVLPNPPEIEDAQAPADQDGRPAVVEESAAAGVPGADVSPTLPMRAGRPGGGWARQVVSKAGPIVAALAGIMVIWYFVSLVVLPEGRRFLLPPPHRVFANTVGNPNVMGPMLDALGQTVLVSIVGLAFAVGIGMSYATVMSQSVWAEKILYPYAVILQTIPILALTPLIGIWFDYGFNARVIVCVIISLFPMISNTLFGLLSASPAAHDLFTLNRATRWQRLSKLQYPAALPSIFTGLRNAAGLSVIGAIVGDFFFQTGKPGIGSLLRTYTLRLNMDNLFMAIILTALFGVVVFSIFAALDRAVIGRWYGHAAR